jgi:hypothetical protein
VNRNGAVERVDAREHWKTRRPRGTLTATFPEAHMHSSKRVMWVTASLIIAIAAITAAMVPPGNTTPSTSVPPTDTLPRPRVLPMAEERDLALEALPPELRANAGVWILTDSGMKELRKSRNGYTCVVNRDEVLAIKPVCFDEEGTATILPVDVYFANRLMAGIPAAQIRTEVAAKFADGTFISPRRAGVAFMLSPRIVNVIDAALGTLGTAPPHYMIYAPNVTNAQLSLPRELYGVHSWLPYVAYGGPHAFIVISVPDSVVSALGHTHGE